MATALISENDIGHRIRKLRTARHMTQESFARSIHISKSYLALIENGKRGSSIDVLAQISRLYSVSVDYLLFGTEITESSNQFKRWTEIVKTRTPMEVDASLALIESFFEINDRYEISDTRLSASGEEFKNHAKRDS